MEYSPFAAEVHSDPYPIYRRLRDEAPLYRHGRLKFWALSRYEDVVVVARDWETFSSASGVDIGSTGSEFGRGNFLEEDPPLHDVLRAVVRTDFVPKQLRAALEPFVRTEVERIVHDLARRPAVDFARELAWELPIVVVSLRPARRGTRVPAAPVLDHRSEAGATQLQPRAKEAPETPSAPPPFSAEDGREAGEAVDPITC
jgi:cytochrome P450